MILEETHECKHIDVEQGTALLSQVALVEMPKFSFDVTMYGGDVSLVPGLEQWLTTFMKDTVFRSAFYQANACSTSFVITQHSSLP